MTEDGRDALPGDPEQVGDPFHRGAFGAESAGFGLTELGADGLQRGDVGADHLHDQWSRLQLRHLCDGHPLVDLLYQPVDTTLDLETTLDILPGSLADLDEGCAELLPGVLPHPRIKTHRFGGQSQRPLPQWLLTQISASHILAYKGAQPPLR